MGTVVGTASIKWVIKELVRPIRRSRIDCSPVQSIVDAAFVVAARVNSNQRAMKDSNVPAYKRKEQDSQENESVL